MAFKCESCSKTYTTKAHLSRHELTHGQRSFECLVCSARFHTRDVLRSHGMLHTEVKPFLCAECGKRFQTQGNKVEHERRHAGLKFFSCDADTCMMRFVTRKELKFHQIKHKVDKSLACTLCPQKFKHQRGMTDHVARIHTREKPYSCMHCTRTFVSSNELKSHSVVHLPSSERTARFQCGDCSQSYLRARDLKRHLKQKHEGPGGTARKLVCSLCPKTYDNTSQLRVHERTHTGEKPNLCSACGRTFKTSSERSDHVRRAHMTERHYVCAVRDCDKTCSTASGLYQHKRTHDEQRERFPCTFCDKPFASKTYVVRHTQIHLNEKPYECSLCDYSTAEASNVRAHEKSVHQGVKRIYRRSFNY